MAEKFRSFYINHVPWQRNAHANVLASLAALLALLAGSTEKILVHSRDLYYPKFVLEDTETLEGDLQVKKVLETSTSSEVILIHQLCLI